jgi:hypothetical protein
MRPRAHRCPCEGQASSLKPKSTSRIWAHTYMDARGRWPGGPLRSYSAQGRSTDIAVAAKRYNKDEWKRNVENVNNGDADDNM